MAGGALPRGGKSAYFRRLSELAPPEVRTRVTQFIDAVAFKEELNLSVEEATTATDTKIAEHDHDGRYALLKHTHGYALLKHKHPEYALLGHTHDHTQLTSIGEYTHDEIDEHIDDDTIHFVEGDISHVNLQDIGLYDHPHIDDHIDDAAIHFTKGSIDHTAIQNIGTNTHAQIDTFIGTTVSATYLPLTAGSTKPLTGDLYVNSAAGYATVNIAGLGNSTFRGWLTQYGGSGGVFEIGNRAGNYASLIDLNAYAQASYDEKVRFFTSKLSSAKSVFEIWDGTTGLDHSFTAGGDVDLCKLGGTLSQNGVAVALSTDLDAYLPLTAGSGKPLSGDLYVETPTFSIIRLDPGGAGANYATMSQGTGIFAFSTFGSTDTSLYFDPRPPGTDDGIIGFFRNTNTSGLKTLTIYVGDGTSAAQHSFNAGTGDVDLCQQGGSIQQNGVDVSLDGHTHVEADITDLGSYLPLTAGSGKPLTEDLYIDTPSSAGIRLRADGDASDYSFFRDQGPAAYLNKVAASGPAVFYFNVQPSDGSSNALIEFFRATNTSASRLVRFYLGNNTSTIQHTINAGTGVVDICQQGGGLKVNNGYVQLPYLAGAPASLVNGMIWMESDGLHLYYAGAEKLVAGV